MFALDDNQTISYFKRFKMEIELFDAPAQPVLPPGYYWVAWDDALVDVHAEIMFGCFHEGIDSVVFPSLGDRQGCNQLVNEISHRHGFLPEATWLLGVPDGYCG